MYWCELLKATDYLTTEQFEDIIDYAIEIIKIITSIIETTKSNINGSWLMLDFAFIINN